MKHMLTECRKIVGLITPRVLEWVTNHLSSNDVHIVEEPYVRNAGVSFDFHSAYGNLINT